MAKVPGGGAVVPVVIAVTAVVGGNRWHNHPPYGPEVLRVKSSLNFVSYVDAQAALGDGVGAPLASEGDQLVLARVSWQTPPEPLDRGWFSFFLIDKRTNLKPGNVSASAPRQLSVSVGGDGVDNKIAERYPWLRGAGDVRLRNGTWVSTGEQVAVFDETSSPVVFVAHFPRRDERDSESITASAPVALSDLLLALVYVGPDRQIYWAQRLQG